MGGEFSDTLRQLKEENEKESKKRRKGGSVSRELKKSIQGVADQLNSQIDEQVEAIVGEEDADAIEAKERAMYEQESAKLDEERKNKIEDFMLGLPIVTVKKVLGPEHSVLNDEYGQIRTAVVDHKGDELIVGIYPGIDFNKIIEGDKAIYDNRDDGTKMLCRIIDCISPAKIPDTTFEDIGGLEEQVAEMKNLLEIFDPKARAKAAILKRKVRNGTLIYGPPGTGKTMLAEAAANYAKVPFFFINTPELFGMYLGQTVDRIKTTVTIAQKFAKKHGGAILYFDEITRLGASRNYESGGADREVSGATEELQALMNGDHYVDPKQGIVLFMASTNLEKKIDSAVLRRFKIHVQVPPPNRAGREEILAVKIRNIKHEKIEIPYLINKLDDIKPNSTGADIDIITEKAKVYAEMGGRDYLTVDDFERSLKDFSRRVDVLLMRESKKDGDSRY